MIEPNIQLPQQSTTLSGVPAATPGVPAVAGATPIHGSGGMPESQPKSWSEKLQQEWIRVRRFLRGKPVVIAAPVFLVILGVVGFFVVQRFTAGDSLDNRGRAAVDDGLATLTLVQSAPQANANSILVNTDTELDFKVNTAGLQTDGVQLGFTIETDTLDAAPTLTVRPDVGLQEGFLKIEPVSNGYKVTALYLPLSLNASYSTTSPQTFATMRFRTTKTGTMKYTFNSADTAVPVHKSSPVRDELSMVPAKTFSVVAPTAQPTADPTAAPTADPTTPPGADPTTVPTAEPTTEPTAEPTVAPTAEPTAPPNGDPTAKPTTKPTTAPGATARPTATPTNSGGGSNGGGPGRGSSTSNNTNNDTNSNGGTAATATPDPFSAGFGGSPVADSGTSGTQATARPRGGSAQELNEAELTFWQRVRQVFVKALQRFRR